MVFESQKGGFCNVKVWFLHYKNHTFKMQYSNYCYRVTECKRNKTGSLGISK